jgi:hypothetical protein
MTMKIRIPESKGQFRNDGSRVYAFGEYRVPEDMPEEVAKAAIEAGVAEVVPESPPKAAGKK